MASKTKRSRDGSEAESSKRPKQLPLDTIRFVPRTNQAPMITTYLVQYYTQLYGQNLFMEEGDRYIDVKFVDAESASRFRQNLYKLNPPFAIRKRSSIDATNIRVKSSGRVTMYQPPRDRDHHDETHYVPHGWTNPFPIQFKVPPPPPPSDTEVANTEEPTHRQRVVPIYPPRAQPLPPHQTRSSNPNGRFRQASGVRPYRLTSSTSHRDTPGTCIAM